MKIGRSVLYYWSPKFFCAIIRPQEVMVMAQCCGNEININDIIDGVWTCPSCGEQYYFEDEDDDDSVEFEEYWPEEFYDSL